jgi:hypothetical protein
LALTEQAEKEAFAAMKMKDDVVCTLWHNRKNTQRSVVRFGKAGALKMVLPFDLKEEDELKFEHPVLGELQVRVERVEESASFSSEEMRISGLFWDFIDSKQRCKHRFPICPLDVNDTVRMLAQYDKMKSGEEDQHADSLDFVWMSKGNNKNDCLLL